MGVRLYEDLVEPGVCFDGQWCPVLAVLKTSFQAGAVSSPSHIVSLFTDHTHQGDPLPSLQLINSDLETN